MNRICTRCARLALGQQHSAYAGSQSTIRTFASSTQLAVDSPNSRSPTRNSPVGEDANQPKLVISRVLSDGPPQAGQVLRRTNPPRTTQSTRTNITPQGAILRRSGPPSQPGQILRRTGPPRQGGRPGAGGKAQGPAGKQRRRRTADSVRAKEAEDEMPTEEAVEEYMTKYIDRPSNPTERIEYNPKAQELVELQKDWPNTPLSTTGLSASLIQKIEWLARRLPHGYQTPEQLAEHFQKGNLTRFESEEEKQQVLKIATELAQQRASMLSDRKGSEIAAEDMSLSEVSSRDEKNKLMNEVVKGEYGDLQRQRMPFLDSVIRNLRNNQTYHKAEMNGFMATIQKLMPAQVQRRPQQQTQTKT